MRSLLLTIHIRPMVQMTPTTAAGQSSPHTAARASAPGTNHADHNQDTARILGRLLVQFLAQGPGVGKQPEGMRSLIPAGKSSKFGSPFPPGNWIGPCQPGNPRDPRFHAAWRWGSHL